VSEAQFQVESDYYVPLLRLLAEFPDGVAKHYVRDLFWERFRDRIPAEHLEPVASNPELHRWINKLDWSSNRLRQYGFIDSPATGVWRITQSGIEWLAQNPQATQIKATARRQRSARRPRSQTSSFAPSHTSPTGITYEMLEQTRKAMPQESFRQVWGTLYDQLLAKERAKAITQISDKELLVAVRQPVRRIQDFLQGRGNDTPKSEDMCDWIQLCYTLGLYREGAALWQYVQRDEVNAWLYERSKKIATVCRTRIGT
jgi:hypothetical protein